jgi:hypothetical protein
MKTSREVLMTIYKNSSSSLKDDQEILEINEHQLHIICKELSTVSIEKIYDEMIFKPPFRVGKKQGKAVLDSNGLLVTLFNKSKKQALLFCNYLNK